MQASAVDTLQNSPIGPSLYIIIPIGQRQSKFSLKTQFTMNREWEDIQQRTFTRW
jgi:hypothetical protein